MVHDIVLEALRKAESARGSSAAIFLDENRLKSGMAWKVLIACLHFLKDDGVKNIKNIRIAFETSAKAEVLERRMKKNKAILLRESIG